MSFKMIANRHVYRIDDKKEYKKGESFTVQTETEKNRLLRNKRARVDDTVTVKAVKTPVEVPQIEQKVLIAEESVESPVASTASPTTLRQNRYRRSDLRSED